MTTRLVLFLLCGLFFHGASAAPASIKLDPAAKRALVEKAITIRKGDTYDQVVQHLGNPTFDRSASAMGGSQRFIMRSLKYYVVFGPGSPNESTDEYISVILDKSDRVKSIDIRVELE